MLSVMPVICMTTSAVSSESGMLTAATMVERRLNRNRKIVRTAKIAPVRPSWSRPSVDCLMNVERSLTTVTAIWSGCLAPISASLALTASATVTVFAADVLLTESVNAWLPSNRA